MKNILFVCTGNICRSPLAEGIFSHLIRHAGLESSYFIDSAGTHAFYNSPPDIFAQTIAAAHGIDISTLRSRQFIRTDLERFDIILATDKYNLHFINSIAADTHGENTELLMRYYPGADIEEVPDPYGSNMDSFNRAFNLINNACSGLLEKLQSQPASVHDR
jgi:protein-tyrosine phosphatase